MSDGINPPGTPQVRCNQCVHYFITHELPFRYGCRALDFKSRRQPALVVMASSGQSCFYFQPKSQDK
ncbi:MAG: hypothetical protein H6R13_3863 [Proteobacteria bacterium]|nr:hypothetical protein [Pseudomonadota bacterium]